MAKFSVRNIWDIVKLKEKTVNSSEEEQRGHLPAVESGSAVGNVDEVQCLSMKELPCDRQASPSKPLPGPVVMNGIDSVKLLAEKNIYDKARYHGVFTPLNQAYSPAPKDVLKHIDNGTEVVATDIKDQPAYDPNKNNEMKKTHDSPSSPSHHAKGRRSPIHVPSKGAFDLSFRKYCARAGLDVKSVDEIDHLYRLYCLVKRKGGYRKVSKLNLWYSVSHSLGNGTDASFEDESSLQRKYRKYLCEYEEHVSRMTAQWMNGHTEDNKASPKSWNDERGDRISPVLTNGTKQNVVKANLSPRDWSHCDRFGLESNSKKSPENTADNGPVSEFPVRRPYAPAYSPSGKDTPPGRNLNSAVISRDSWTTSWKSDSQAPESLWERIQSRHEKIVSTSGPFSSPARVRPRWDPKDPHAPLSPPYSCSPSSSPFSSPSSLLSPCNGASPQLSPLSLDQSEYVVSSSTSSACSHQDSVLMRCRNALEQTQKASSAIPDAVCVRTNGASPEKCSVNGTHERNPAVSKDLSRKSPQSVQHATIRSAPLIARARAMQSALNRPMIPHPRPMHLHMGQSSKLDVQKEHRSPKEGHKDCVTQEARICSSSSVEEHKVPHCLTNGDHRSPTRTGTQAIIIKDVTCRDRNGHSYTDDKHQRGLSGRTGVSLPKRHSPSHGTKESSASPCVVESGQCITSDGMMEQVSSRNERFLSNVQKLKEYLNRKRERAAVCNKSTTEEVSPKTEINSAQNKSLKIEPIKKPSNSSSTEDLPASTISSSTVSKEEVKDKEDAITVSSPIKTVTSKSKNKCTGTSDMDQGAHDATTVDNGSSSHRKTQVSLGTQTVPTKRQFSKPRKVDLSLDPSWFAVDRREVDLYRDSSELNREERALQRAMLRFTEMEMKEKNKTQNEEEQAKVDRVKLRQKNMKRRINKACSVLRKAGVRDAERNKVSRKETPSKTNMRPKQDAPPAVVEEEATPSKETPLKKERKRKSVVKTEPLEEEEKPEEVKKVKVQQKSAHKSQSSANTRKQQQDEKTTPSEHKRKIKTQDTDMCVHPKKKRLSEPRTPVMEDSIRKTPKSSVKTYMLIPSYQGFKDFKPTILGSRLRSKAPPSEECPEPEKEGVLPKEVPLLVVEKQGAQVKNKLVTETKELRDLVKESLKAQGKWGDEFMQDEEEGKEGKEECRKNITVNRATGESVLHKAARLGYSETVEYYIKLGYDVNAKDNAGWTPLHEACARGRLHVVKVLVQYGADVNSCSNNGIRPLHDAAEAGHVNILRVLMAYGADPLLCTYSGLKALDCAKSKLAEELLTGAEGDFSIREKTATPNFTTEDGWDFTGSCSFLDTEERISGIFDDEPDASNADPEFELSNEPHLPTVNLPLVKDDCVIGRKNYILMQDILEREGVSRETFLKRHRRRFELRSVPVSEYLQEVSRSQVAVNSLASSDGCAEDDMVELVALNWQLRVALGIKTEHVDL